MIKVGNILAERYDIIQRIGSGGMSVVYKAKDNKLGRFVAIKVLREEYCLDDSFVGKFKVEAQSAASLSHNNIVNIYDVGEEGRTHYIVMEYLEGETLKEYIGNTGHLSDVEILKIAVCIASALDHAHNNHIIHRDIKPQNIMLTNDGKVKVMDFGIARIATGNTIEMPENPSGSVHYIAPEQARGGFQDNRSDIYSLGIVMYEMATGTLPFNGDNAVSVALMQIHDELPSPLVKNENLSKNIDLIITKATMKKSSQRYQSALEVINDIKKCMSNPEDVLIYTIDSAPEETMIMSHEEMKHIWSKNEILEYSGKKDPLDRVVTILGVLLAVTVATLIAIFAYQNIASRYIPVKVSVPDLVGESRIDALTELEAISLNLEIGEERFDEEYAQGYIISQTPEADFVVLEDETVTVVVSKGIELITVPGVVNQNYEDAVATLENDGFTVNMITEYNGVVPVGQIMRQDPYANKQVMPETVITIYASAGPEDIMVEMPDIIDMEEAEAINNLRSLNLKVGKVNEVFDDDIEEGYVVSTSVEPGREIKEEYVVDLIVSLGPEIVLVTKSFNVNNVADVGQDEYTLKVTLDLDGNEEVLYDDDVDASVFPLTLQATGRGQGIIHVYNNNTQVYQVVFTFTDLTEEN